MASLLKIHTVRYLDTSGRQVPKGTEGARRVKQKSRKWYGQFKDTHGRFQRVALYADKAASRSKLAEIERAVERGESGLVDRFAKHRRATIESHVDAYEAHLRVEGVSAGYLKEDLRRVRAVLDHAEARSLGDITSEAVVGFLAAVAKRGTGVSTRNDYLKSIRSFVRWCVGQERMTTDVLKHLKRAKGPTCRNRRALTEDELNRLLAAARERPLVASSTISMGKRKGQVAGNLSPETRADRERKGWEHSLIYKTLVLTGLRRGELAAVEVRHLKLTGKRPCLTLPGESTKNHKGADIPLRDDLVADLREWLKATDKAGPDRVFYVSREFRKTLDRDLAWAGIPKRDENGRTIDVHALRHTTATYLGKAKVAARVAQKFMRHEDIKLTMQVYSDPSLFDEGEALEALPDLGAKGRTAGAKSAG
jgi:integrase